MNEVGQHLTDIDVRRRLEACAQEMSASLFDCSGIPLPIHPIPGVSRKARQEYLHQKKPARLSLVSRAGRHFAVRCDPYQLNLPLSNSADVIRLVSHRRQAYLDYGVYDTFRSVPIAVKAALEFEANGIYVLGQLVQISEAEVRASRFVDEIVIAAMKQHLAIIDFDFGMQIPSWNRLNGSLLSAKSKAVGDSDRDF